MAEWKDGYLWESGLTVKRIMRRQVSESPHWHWQSPKMREMRQGLYHEADTGCQREDSQWCTSVPGEAPTMDEHRNPDVDLVSTLMAINTKPGWWDGE